MVEDGRRWSEMVEYSTSIFNCWDEDMRIRPGMGMDREDLSCLVCSKNNTHYPPPTPQHDLFRKELDHLLESPYNHYLSHPNQPLSSAIDPTKLPTLTKSLPSISHTPPGPPYSKYRVYILLLQSLQLSKLDKVGTKSVQSPS
jgi:hypothetical protein